MKKIIILILAIMSSTITMAAGGGDQTVGSIANSVVDEILNVPDLMASMSYVFAVFLGIQAILKFKEHNESKGQVKLIVPVMLFFACALMFTLPSALGVGVKTLGLDQASQKKTEISRF